MIVRLSDFKSNEYANLIGGKNYEPHEENPMLGFRGASRYIDKVFRPCFELECRALKRVRDEMGLTNVQVMVPFVRTLLEAKTVTQLLADNGLKRGDNGLKHIMMCELPTNAVLADRYLEYFDGMSIGSNDMTQLALGLDRDSGVVAKLFDERDDAVKALMAMAIKACKAQGKYVGICGQGPSDHPELARWLVEQGIDSLSLESRHGGRDLDVPRADRPLAENRRPPRSGRPQQPLAIELQLADRLAHVVQGEMRGVFLKCLGDLRRPALRQFLERAHVEIAVVEEALERRHVAREEAPILADAVAAHGRAAPLRPRIRETRAFRARPRRHRCGSPEPARAKPEPPCCLRFQSSMAASTSSL